MKLTEYGIDYKKIPHGFWKTFVKKYDKDNYMWWCLDEMLDPDDKKSAFKYFWRPTDGNKYGNPYNYLYHVINEHLDKGEEIPAFIQKLRKK